MLLNFFLFFVDISIKCKKKYGKYYSDDKNVQCKLLDYGVLVVSGNNCLVLK